MRMPVRGGVLRAVELIPGHEREEVLISTLSVP